METKNLEEQEDKINRLRELVHKSIEEHQTRMYNMGMQASKAGFLTRLKYLVTRKF